MLADELLTFWEGQYEVQKQRRLQQTGNFIGPKDESNPESVELAGIVGNE